MFDGMEQEPEQGVSATPIRGEAQGEITGGARRGFSGDLIMTVGTRSVIFGVHSLFVHPFFVAAGWWKLYGFPRDVRLWLSFALHDIGYVGRSFMEGPEAEAHVELGARIMGKLFGRDWAEFSKLCGIRGNFKRFLGQRGMGVRGKGAASPLAPLSNVETDGVGHACRGE
jgi:hypothetical protein